MAKLSISLLGPFIAELDGEPLSGFRSAKVRALLAYLAVESGRPWSRTTLADLFWPDLLENKAQSNLRNAISNLRDVIGDRRENPPFLFVSQDTLQYNQKSDTWLDVSAVMDFVATASEAGGRVCNQDDIDLMEHTLALYRGDFMEGFSIASAPFEEWALVKSEQIRQKMLQAVRYLVMGYEQSGELDKALHLARRWVELEPWEEAAHRSLMRILFGKGQRNAALVQYEACRQLLINDLGVEPEPATTQLYEQIRTGQIDPRINEKELFDTSHPGQMPSFLQGKHKLQSELTLFVDRQEEIKRLKSELDKAVSGKGGILFVTGDPGSGKTALLAEFARRAMIQYRDLVVVWGQCNAYTGAGDPYFPFLEVAQMLSGDVEARVVGGAITPEHATRLWNILPKVIWALLNDGPDLINRFVSGRDLLANAKMNNGVKPEQLARLHTQVEQLSQQAARPGFQQETLFSQFTKVLSILSQRNPLVLILDDLQWIDTDSVNLLFHLVRKLSGNKILLLGAYRPEEVALGRQGERHPIEGVIHELQTNLGDIHIDLMQNEGVDFVESILDSEPNKLSRDFRRMLHRHTAGHPLFTIELLRGMQLRGDIRRNEQGKWVAGARLNWDELPVRVEAVIAERIGHLPKDYQDLLRIASVEGEQFTAEILARIQGKEELDVIHILSQKISKLHRLVIAQSRKQIRGQNLSQYRFRHFLYQKYLYNQLDEVEKAYLHEKVGSALEELFYHQDLLKYPE
ncbi:MAG: AAA family ATPase, partial [Chloroflexi bacterium]|nr:AAA family ATPase [Chloroflexota bacterium]